MAGDLVRQHAVAAAKSPHDPAITQLTRRRAAALLALAPAAFLLAACTGMKPESGRQHPRTDRNGQRGAR
jgi:hypothetical protein